MRVNIYYLVVGTLSLLFCVTHALNGHTNVLPLIAAANLELSTKTSVLYIWHIISVENLVFGVAFLIMAFIKDAAKVTFAAFMIAAIIAARWLVIFASTLLMDMQGISSTLIDSVAIVIYIALIVLGALQKDNKDRQNKLHAGN